MPTYRADIDTETDKRYRYKRTFWLSALLILSLLVGFGTYQARAYMLDGLPKLPNKQTMWELNLKDTITLLDKDGQVIGHRGPYIGEPLKLTDLPNHVPEAFLAIEDERFYQHAGIDNKAILRAIITNTKSGERSQGASTLTQQLVKNMVLTPEKTYRRKIQEMLLARDMEARLSKPEILELYLNRINLGPQVYGVEAAANRYFGKSARKLTLSESALLAGLPQAPSRYDPTRHFDRAMSRSHLVLDRMVATGSIRQEEALNAKKDIPVISEGAKPLLDESNIGYVFDLVAEQAEGLMGRRAKDLVVTTTLDLEKQKTAYNSLNSILAKKSTVSRKASEAALVSLDNKDGAIRVMVGGRDYNASKFNRASQAQRQPGSAFKAFVYATAIEDGFTAGTIRSDQPTTIAGWSPQNYTKRYRGPMTLREALKLSINTIAAQVGSEVGPRRIVQLANKFGIKSDLRPQYSIALGTSEVNLLELTSAYSIFANEGLLNEPYIITKITNTAKRPLYTRRTETASRVYPAPFSRQMTSMLRDVVDSMRKVTGGLLPADLWKTYMLAAHKDLENKALKAPDKVIGSTQTAEQMAFYSNLTNAFTRERDVANGLNQ